MYEYVHVSGYVCEYACVCVSVCVCATQGATFAQHQTQKRKVKYLSGSSR